MNIYLLYITYCVIILYLTYFIIQCILPITIGIGIGIVNPILLNSEVGKVTMFYVNYSNFLILNIKYIGTN